MTTAANPTREFSRPIPAVCLATMLVLLLLHHWNAVANREVYPAAALFFATFAGLSLGGVIYPPIFYASGKYGKHLPVTYKVLAGISAAIGFACGMYLMFSVYGN